jgi:hypothetical protein
MRTRMVWLSGQILQNRRLRSLGITWIRGWSALKLTIGIEARWSRSVVSSSIGRAVRLYHIQIYLTVWLRGANAGAFNQFSPLEGYKELMLSSGGNCPVIVRNWLPVSIFMWNGPTKVCPDTNRGFFAACKVAPRARSVARLNWQRKSRGTQRLKPHLLSFRYGRANAHCGEVAGTRQRPGFFSSL